MGRARVHQGRGRSPRPHDGRRLQEEHGCLLELAGWKAARLKNKDLKKQRQEKQRQRQEKKNKDKDKKDKDKGKTKVRQRQEKQRQKQRQEKRFARLSSPRPWAFTSTP